MLRGRNARADSLRLITERLLGRKECVMGQLKRRGQTWWIRYYRNGKRYEESSGSAKEGDARRLLRLREGDIERGIAITPKVGRIRFEEAVKDVLNDYRTNRKRSLDSR